MVRLEKQVEKLSTFHSLHRCGFYNVDQARQTQSFQTSSILTTSRSRSNFRSLPARPFFVAAILEAIENSKFVSIIEVVPGEADAYCAATARQGGGTILTNDSDLLIYDLGPDGAVGSLTGLELITYNNVGAMEVCAAVQTAVIKPRDVARLLGLKDLKSLAYVLKEHSELPFHVAIHKAQHVRLYGSQYQQILGEYLIEPAAFESCMFRQEILTRIRTRTPFLDPRISEFILQCDRQSASIYLPVMIEDPNRAPAFAGSISQRLFAYSCCILPYKVQGRKVFEYGRKGQKIYPTSIELMSGVRILEHAKSLRIKLQHFKTVFSAFPEPLVWRMYALAEIYHWYLDTNRTPPSRDNMTTAITGNVTDRITWGDIHLNAQIEASLYSLRIIQQVLGFVLPSDPGNEAEILVLKILTYLKNDLADLPPLKQLMPNRWELLAQTANIDVDELLNSLANIIQDDVSQEGTVDGVNGKNDERAHTGRRKHKRIERASR